MKKASFFRTLSVLMMATFILASSSWAAPWKFGVMSDTQWTTTDPTGMNPNGVSVSIINQINQQFINQKVKFVIQVGDLTENGFDADIAKRAEAALPLIGAGIGFFPMRGNHETYANDASGNNLNSYGIPAFQANFPQTRGISNAFGAKHFNSPTSVSTDLNGMSYSFDYRNARFVIIDPWVTPTKIDKNPDGYNYGYTINDQQPWISHRLNKATRGHKHAFVFSHQPLIAENHQDTMFNGYTNANPDWQNVFYGSLQNNNVKYFISGHDHIHQRSIVTSPDASSNVQELIAASDSSKYYTPKDLTDTKWYGQKTRETSLSQERYTAGYYIYTIDGPRVTVDYYSDDQGNWFSDNCFPISTNGSGTKASCGAGLGSHITPTFNFVKKETWGYSLNGKEFLVPQNGTYTVVSDTFPSGSHFFGTTAKILSGTNGSTAQDYNGRHFTKAVNTGWTHMDRWHEEFSHHKRNSNPDLVSNILTLWGMTDLGASSTDTYVLSMSYEPGHSERLGNGGFGIATKDDDDNWINAVDNNVGGTKTFVKGPWKASYGLGTYGVDPSTKTVWAVINYDGSFAVTNGIGLVGPAPVVKK